MLVSSGFAQEKAGHIRNITFHETEAWKAHFCNGTNAPGDNFKNHIFITLVPLLGVVK